MVVKWIEIGTLPHSASGLWAQFQPSRRSQLSVRSTHFCMQEWGIRGHRGGAPEDLHRATFTCTVKQCLLIYFCLENPVCNCAKFGPHRASSAAKFLMEICWLPFEPQHRPYLPHKNKTAQPVSNAGWAYTLHNHIAYWLLTLLYYFWLYDPFLYLYSKIPKRVTVCTAL